MAESGSEKRQRKVKRTVRLTTLEDALLCTYADHAGLTIASYLRHSALHMPPPRAARRPTVNHQLAVRLLAEIGQLNTAFRAAVAHADGVDPQAVETAIRDQSELRLVLLESMGLAP